MVNLHVIAQTVDTLEHFAAVWTLVRRRAVHTAAVVVEQGARLAGVHAAGVLTIIIALR